MNGVIRLWWLPVAIFKWTMFGLHFTRSNWDGSSYSYDIQLIARTWSPIYWIRAILVFVFMCKLDITVAKKFLQTETNIVTAEHRTHVGYIPITILKSVRYVYYFTTLYVL